MTIQRRPLLILLLAGCLGSWFFLLWLAESYEPGENYSLIEEGLYMGGAVIKPPPGTRAVLALCRAKDRYRTAMDFYLAEPISDSEPAPGLEWLQKMVDFIDARQRAGLPIFVHCRNGVSRSGLVIIAYIMFQKHLTRDQALAFVRSRRPQTRPNPAFMERLLDWENALKCVRWIGKPATAIGSP